MRSVVDFPQPDGPTRHDKFLVVDLEIEIADGHNIAGVDLVARKACHDDFLPISISLHSL